MAVLSSLILTDYLLTPYNLVVVADSTSAFLQMPKCAMLILGWPKCFIGFLHYNLRENPNKLIGQPIHALEEAVLLAWNAFLPLFSMKFCFLPRADPLFPLSLSYLAILPF